MQFELSSEIGNYLQLSCKFVTINCINTRSQPGGRWFSISPIIRPNIHVSYSRMHLFSFAPTFVHFAPTLFDSRDCITS